MIRPTRPLAWVVHAALIAIVGGLSLWRNADFSDPPRYDGAGYAVLARSIVEGRGYREIDKPDAPRHAHFPPGYPLALAALWSMTGVSAFSAHAFSFGCTLTAMLLSWTMFRLWFAPKVALLMGLTLAVNWRWGRDGTAIQSEPLFLVLSLSTVLASAWVLRSGGLWRSVVLGLLLGASILTRHVGITLAAAILYDLLLRQKYRSALIAIFFMGIVISPWAAWLAIVRDNTQVELLEPRNLIGTLTGNFVFYLRRFVDQIIGPVVEVATVFRPRFSGWATAGAILGYSVLCLGWFHLHTSHRDRGRLAYLVNTITILLLLVWPFTEAGRFLIPLIPFLILAFVEGLAILAFRFRSRRPRILAAWIVLMISLPYSVYAIASGRSEAARQTNRDFDDACGWITRQKQFGSVLTRHPGEVFWATGRTALSPDSADVAKLIERDRVAFLLIDDERFAKAAKSPLGQFVADNPQRVELAFTSGGDRPVFVYRVKNPD